MEFQDSLTGTKIITKLKIFRCENIISFAKGKFYDYEIYRNFKNSYNKIFFLDYEKYT